MPDSFVVLVTGGRDYQDRATTFATLDAVHAARPITLVRHGACGANLLNVPCEGVLQPGQRHSPNDLYFQRFMRGADRWGDEWAIQNMVPVDRCPSDWTRQGKRAGFLRNGTMLERQPPVDLVVALPGSRGTADMCRQAEAKGVPVLRVAELEATHNKPVAETRVIDGACNLRQVPGGAVCTQGHGGAEEPIPFEDEIRALAAPLGPEAVAFAEQFLAVSPVLAEFMDQEAWRKQAEQHPLGLLVSDIVDESRVEKSPKQLRLEGQVAASYKRIDDFVAVVEAATCHTCGPCDHTTQQCGWGFCSASGTCQRCPNGTDKRPGVTSLVDCCSSPLRDWPEDWFLTLRALEEAGLKVEAADEHAAYLSGGFAAYKDRPPAELLAALDRAGNWGPGEGLEAWCDGSGTTGDKPAGIGVVLRERLDVSDCGIGETSVVVQEVSENIGPGTNQRAELMGVWRVLTLCPDLNVPLIVRTDSTYAIGCSSDPTWKIKANKELVERIRQDLARRRAIEFEHVRGHQGDENNERADKLAREGRMKK